MPARLPKSPSCWHRWVIGYDRKGDFGIDAAEETAVTFIENALLKARHASRLSGLPALADDSGLEVDALGGAPGLYSARYRRDARCAGSGDAANNALLLLQHLEGVADARSTRTLSQRGGIASPCRRSLRR